MATAEFPSLAKEGWLRHREKRREATFEQAQTGWFDQQPIVGCRTNHPGRAEFSVTLHLFVRRGVPSFTKERNSPFPSISRF